MLTTTKTGHDPSPRSGRRLRTSRPDQVPRAARRQSADQSGTSKSRRLIFTLAVTAATLAPAATAPAGFTLSNHNETLLLDA